MANAVGIGSFHLSKVSFTNLIPDVSLKTNLNLFIDQPSGLLKPSRTAGVCMRRGVICESTNSRVEGNEERKPRILIAGGGIGGLVLALAVKNKGFDVKVFEKDLSAVRGEGQYRGPIQIQSNALASLQAVDADVAEEIMDNGCVTGDRINGLVDGLSGACSKLEGWTPSCRLSDKVSEQHACIVCIDNAFFLTDLCSQHGTWITDNYGKRYRVPPNLPMRIHPSYVIEFGPHKQAALRVKLNKVLLEENLIRHDTRTLDVA